MGDNDHFDVDDVVVVGVCVGVAVVVIVVDDDDDDDQDDDEDEDLSILFLDADDDLMILMWRLLGGGGWSDSEVWVHWISLIFCRCQGGYDMKSFGLTRFDTTQNN